MCFIHLLDSSFETMKMEPSADILVQCIVLGMNLEIFLCIPITACMTSNLQTPLGLIWWGYFLIRKKSAQYVEHAWNGICLIWF